MSEEDAKALLKNGAMCFAEGANMPLDEHALDVVTKSKALFLPAKAANAGGVAVSGFERSQNAVHIQADLDRVESRLQTVMKSIHDNCLKRVDKINGVIPYKVGANLYAFEKVQETTKALWG